jgi:hypothetical protein
VKVKIGLSVDQKPVLQDVLTIEESRLGELTEEEIERAIEIRIMEWTNRHVHIEWEVEEEE